MCPADAFAEPFDFNVAGQQMTMAKIDIEACRSYCGPDAYGAQCGRECMTTCPVGTVQK